MSFHKARAKFFQKISGIPEQLLGTILTLSSSFFVVLIIALLLYPQALANFLTILLIAVVLMGISANKSLPEKIRNISERFVRTAGSIAFLIFYLGALLGNKGGYWMRIFDYYSRALEQFSNLLFIGIIITVIFFFLILYISIELLKVLLKGFAIIASKFQFGEKIRQVSVFIMVIAWIIGFWLALHIFLSESNLTKATFTFSPFLIPLLGFSLLYLHAKFLAGEFLKFFSTDASP